MAHDSYVFWMNHASFYVQGETMQRNDRPVTTQSTRFNEAFPFKLLVTLLLSTTLLTGCDHSATDSTKTQSVAKINGKEITIHEVNQYITQLPQLDGTAEQIKQRAIEAVIDQNLLLQAAKEAKLDRDPDVLQSLLWSNKKILVDAYLSRQFTQLPFPSDADITAYYQAHPELFSEHKLLQIEQFDILANEEQQATVLAALRDSATVDIFINWLKTQHIAFDKLVTVKDPDDMDPHEKSTLSKIKVGEAALLKQDHNVMSVAILNGTQLQPIVLENAKVRISQEIMETQRQQKIAALVKTFRSKAKIEYLGGKEAD